MRRPFLVEGTFHHIVLRGGRDMDIMPGDNDKWECNHLLFYQNDEARPVNWERDLNSTELFGRPKHWGERDPLTAIHAYSLHSNHLHLACEEVREGGISLFMSRFGKGLTHRINKRYGGQGSIFQGPYKARLIESNTDLINVSLYVMVKNVFERYPYGGIKGAYKNFENAFQWACKDPFSSFPDYAVGRNSPIVDTSFVSAQFKNCSDFKKEVKNYLASYIQREEDDLE